MSDHIQQHAAGGRDCESAQDRAFHRATAIVLALTMVIAAAFAMLSLNIAGEQPRECRAIAVGPTRLQCFDASEPATASQPAHGATAPRIP